MTKRKRTQIYIRIENIGKAYFESIHLHNPGDNRWRDNVPEYLQEKEKQMRWEAMYGTGKYITVVFESDYCGDRDLIEQGIRLLKMATAIHKTEQNPFSALNWNYGSRELPGTCIYNLPETGIAHLHAYISGIFDSALADYCEVKMPFFRLLNREIYNTSKNPAGEFSCFDEMDNTHGVLLVDFISRKYALTVIEKFNVQPGLDSLLEKLAPYSAKDFLWAQHAMADISVYRLNQRFVKSISKFEVLTMKEIIQWFPAMAVELNRVRF